MFRKFSDVLQTAADVLAPPATRLEDFEYHFKNVLNFYQNYDDSTKFHIEDTRVPHHLHAMIQLIAEEEEEQQGGTIGACLEALVNHTICFLDVLPAMAVADRPPGARALALNLATQLLRRTRQPCINNSNVFRPLQRMLILCNEILASPTEKEEVELLLTLCGLVRKDSGLANIFTTPYIEDKASLLEISEDIKKLIPITSKSHIPKKNPLFAVELPSNPLGNVSLVRICSREEHQSSASNSSIDDKNCSTKSQKTVYEEHDKFILIDLLISYLNSADNQVVQRACEGIMILFSLPEDDIANLVTSCSPVCETIIDKLSYKYKNIPANVDPSDIDHLNITWAYVAQDFGDKNYNKFHGYRELTSFFSWVDYIDTLAKECHPTIRAHLARTFRQNFLETTAEGGLAHLHHAVVTTAIIAKCIKDMDSFDLVTEFVNWMSGDGDDSEWRFLHTLLSNCLTENCNLTVETLRVFEAIIEKGSEQVIERMVLCQLCTRSYFCIQEPVEEDERDRLNDVPLWRERESNKEAMRQLQHEEHVQEQISDILSHEGLDAASPADAPDNIHRTINSFLLLLPRALLSDPVGADYEHYIHDAHRHYQLWLDITSNFNWPSEHSCVDNTTSSTHSYDSRPEADLHLEQALGPLGPPGPLRLGDSKAEQCNQECPLSQGAVHKCTDATSAAAQGEFDEGPFLKMLFRLLSNMPGQPYQVNLHLTSIISKLALIPHPYLHEYLLNPMLPTAKKTPTLFKVLQDVAKRLTTEIPRMKNYKKVIENTRIQLMSEDPSYDESGEHNQLVESLIVLEEFCKELAAIAFVKYQHSITMQR